MDIIVGEDSDFEFVSLMVFFFRIFKLDVRDFK